MYNNVAEEYAFAGKVEVAIPLWIVIAVVSYLFTMFGSTALNVHLLATQATLYVDGTALPQQMTYVSGSYNTGALYQLSTTLSPGAHTLYYVFSDGQTSWALPLSPGTIGFTVSAATVQPHSIALHIPTFDLSNILSNPTDPGDID